ncbi:MAG: fibronectin type III domain-containing protein [Eubacterium sp.]|nr:fibronectin type III domain-containing protein [Eubacterium sp.]
MKKFIIILIIVALMLTTNISVQAELENPMYNNQEKIVRVSDIDGKWWNGISYQYGTNSQCIMGRMKEMVGEEPYWRLGNNCYYAIYKIEENGIHYLIMNFPGKVLGGAWYVSKIPSKELFQKYVHIGTSIELVKLIDPDTFNTFEMKRNPICLTVHRFDDGTYAQLIYQKDSQEHWVVNKMHYSTDPNHVVENLLDIDYQLIKNDNPNEEAEFLEKLKKLEGIPTVQNKYKKPAKVKIKSAKRIKKKTILVKFKKAKNAKKYQIQYATNKKFKKAKMKTTKKYSYIIKKLSKNKTYYIRVRGINGTKRGEWSKTKKVRSVKCQVVQYDIRKGGTKYE